MYQLVKHYSSFANMSRQIYKRNSRNDTEDFLFGQPCKLPNNVLPTDLDVGRAVLHTQLEMAKNSTGNHCKNKELKPIFNMVAMEIKAIWDKASIPCSRIDNISRKIEALFTKKNSYRKKKSNLINEIDNWSKLFDICLCRCEKFPDIPFTCKCPTHKKVKTRELDFLFDQRGPRNLCIGEIDLKATARLQE